MALDVVEQGSCRTSTARRLNAICLIVAGVVRATLPTTELNVAWQHSVEKTHWEEHYRIDGDRLALVRARVQGMGAGMEPGPDAVLRDGWWTWRPDIGPLRELRLSHSDYTADYDLCWAGTCRKLAALAATGHASEVVIVRPCALHNANAR